MRDDRWLADKKEIEREYGKWVSYEIANQGSGFFLQKPTNDFETTPFVFIERIFRCISDISKKSITKITALDLGCMEGVVSLALASWGMRRVIGVDARESHIAKALFAKDVLGLKRVDFFKRDVRALRFAPGEFDVVLALGIIYHLDASDIFRLLSDAFNWTNEMLIVDTHISFHPRECVEFNGRMYWGSYYDEPQEMSLDSSQCYYAASVGNKRSFWFTRASLLNLLSDIGYTAVYVCVFPRGGMGRDNDDRLTLIATKVPALRSTIFSPSSLETVARFEEREFGMVVIHPLNNPS